MAVEFVRGYDFIYGVLHGDTTLMGLVGSRLYNEMPPQGITVPFIVYQYLGGADLVVAGGTRVQSTGVYLVKVVHQTQTYAAIRAIADRIDTLLHRRTGAAGADGWVFSCVRVGVDPLPPEIVSGVEYRSIAARYALALQV